MRRASVVALAWIVAYLVLVSLPLGVLLLGRAPAGLGYAWDLSMGLAFAGLGVVAVQFGLTARFRRASAPFGIDILYYFHRWMAVGGLLLLAGHWLVLRVSAPTALEPWPPLEAPAHMTAGRAALLLLGLLVATSLWRKRLRLEYDRWRRVHALLAVAAVVLAGVHIVGAGYYTGGAWSRELLGAYTASWVALLFWVRLGKPWRLLRRPWRVAEVRPERGRCWTLTLEPDGHEGMRFQPGQFVWLSLGHSPLRALEHPFSIAGGNGSTRLELTIKELGDFTRAVGDTPVGEAAWVDGPHGVFTVDRHPHAPGYGFVAGGVGIAPIMSMLRTLAERGDPRPLRLLYANDAWEATLFREELDDLALRLDLETTHVVRRPPPGWEGEEGLLTPELVRRWADTAPPGTEYFLCGPGPMRSIAEGALRDHGVPLARLHSEIFDLA